MTGISPHVSGLYENGQKMREVLPKAELLPGYFSQHGYAGVSMRGIAGFLGVSKSALYHYFPSKESLFLACTEQVMMGVEASLSAGGAPEEAQIAQLMAAMRKDFGAEMALLFDYLRGKDREAIAADEAMQIALKACRRTVAKITGPEKADETLAMILGTLLLEHLSGGTWPLPSGGG